MRNCWRERGILWDDERKMTMTECKTVSDKNKAHIQDEEGKPVFFGSDVVALYPNLEPTSVARLAGKSIRKTKVKFRNINYYFLLVYNYLVLGVNKMTKIGLHTCIPKRKRANNKNIMSLAAGGNRDLDNWDFSGIELNDKICERFHSEDGEFGAKIPIH